jgi:hypothetical protein
LKDKSLIIIVGAGVTLSATADKSGKPLSRITWTGLIRNGLDYLVTDGYADDSNPEIKEAYTALKNTDTDSLLNAAKIMRSHLAEHGQFPTWLETVFGNLYQEVRHPTILEMLKSLHEKGATLLTTNYDDLLEESCGLRRIGRSNQNDILKFKRGKLDGVFHVHGSYHDPHEVVLDTTDYYEIKKSDEVQNILKKYLEWNTILFIGCGSGLEDPNFDTLLKWAYERQKDIPNGHYLLIRNGDNLSYKPLVRLKYGSDYQDLAPYLKKLLDDSFQPADSGPQEDALHSSGIPPDHTTDAVKAVGEHQTVYQKSDDRTPSQGSEFEEESTIRSPKNSVSRTNDQTSDNVELTFSQDLNKSSTNRRALSLTPRVSKKPVGSQIALTRAQTYVVIKISRADWSPA